MVITRAHVFGGKWQALYDEIAAFKQASGSAHMKVILGTGDLLTLRNVARASFVAMMAGADFIKTSTGKIQPAATMPVTLVMLEAIRDYFFATGIRIGMKPAGGIRTVIDLRTAAERLAAPDSDCVGQQAAILAEGDEDDAIEQLLSDADRLVEVLALLAVEVLDQFEPPPLIRLVQIVANDFLAFRSPAQQL